MNETGETPTAVLRAARQLFAERGYEGTSIRAITALAGANLGAVTYHFRTKERLYEAVLEGVTGPLLVRLREAAAASSSPLGGIEAVIRSVLEHRHRNPDWPSLMLHELALDRTLPAPVRRTMQEVFQIVSGLVRRGQEEGSIVDGDPMLLALSIISQPLYFALVQRRLHDAFGLDVESRATRQRIADHIVRVVRRSLATSGRSS
jgi:AcrR family transcriptional regulator